VSKVNAYASCELAREVAGITARSQIGQGRMMLTEAPSTITGTTIGTGDGPARVSMVWVPRSGILRGLAIPQVLEPSADTVRFNLSWWSEVLSGADLLPGTMFPGAWGLATLDQAGANTQVELCAFQNDVPVVGGRWYKIVSFVSVGAGATGASFRKQTLQRADGDGSGYNRFDVHSTTTQAFPTGDPSGLLGGLAWTDASDVGERIDYGLWWR